MIKKHYLEFLKLLLLALIAVSATALAQGDHSLSENGLNFIAEHEGVLYNLYDDPAGHCTIGIGHLVHKGKCDGSASEQEFLGGITKDQALALLKSDVAIAEQAVNTYVTVPLTQAQFDALVSFTYNLGSGNFKNSDLLKKLNAGQYDAVPGELNKWVYGGGKVLPGLVTRRSDEGTLFQSESSPSGVSKQITLTLYVHDGERNGPVISGAQVTGKDGSGNSFQQTTDSSGYVTITGDPGTWSFTASADGHATEIWGQDITEDCTKHAFVQKEQQEESAVLPTSVTPQSNVKWQETSSTDTSQSNTQETTQAAGQSTQEANPSSSENTNRVELKIWVHAEPKPPENPRMPTPTSLEPASGTQITIYDGAGNEVPVELNSYGEAVAYGAPGTWKIVTSAPGYDTNTWSEEVSSTSPEVDIFQELATQEHTNLSTTLDELSFGTTQGSEGSVVGIWNLQNLDQKGSWTFNFNKDGTFDSIPGGYYPGTWVQTGNVVRFQSNPSWVWKGTITGNIMSCTTSHTVINEVVHWKGVRADT